MLPRIYLFTALLAAPLLAQQDCEDGWTKVDNKCLKYYSGASSFNNARLQCSKNGARLAIFRDRTEMDSLLNGLNDLGLEFWLGATLRENRLEIQSDTQSTGLLEQLPGFYGPDQPRYDTGRCVKGENFGVQRGILWSFTGCEQQLPFVCQSICNVGEYHCSGQGCVPNSQPCYIEDPSAACLEEHDFSTNANTFRSRGYTSGKYPPGQTCTYKLRTSSDRILKLQFDVFEMGSDKEDYISVYIGGTDPEFAQFYGTFDSSSGLQGNIIYSTNNELVIVMVTDTRTGDDRRGFSLTSLPLSRPASYDNEDISVTDDPNWAVISSPEYAAVRGRELTSFTGQWTLTAGALYHVIVRIDELDLSDDSRLSLIGFTSSGVPYTRVTYTSAMLDMDIPRLVVSPTNVMIIRYTTGRGPHWNNKGFSLSYQRSTPEACSVTINRREGTVSSPGYGLTAVAMDGSEIAVQYPNNVDCSARIAVPGITGTTAWNFTLWFNTTFSLDPNDKLTLTTYENGVGVSYNETGDAISGRKYRSLALAEVRMVTDTVNPASYHGFKLYFSQDCPDLEVSQWTELSADAPYKYEDVVEFSCLEGYEFQDDGLTGTTATIECLIGGWWSIPRIPSCQPVFCDRPPSVNNGYVSHSEGLTFGNIATYRCFDGLSLSGNENVTCQSDKTWSIPPTCDVLNCELLAPGDTSITNHTITAGPDRVDANTYTYGNTVELNCAEGYIATGNVSVACIGYDVWTAPMGTCEKIKCNYVPVTNGMMSTDTTDRTSTTQWILDQHNRTYFYEYYTLNNMTIKQAEFEDEVHVWCRSGYIINGTDSNTASLKCSSDGEFGVIPTCVNTNECDMSQCDHDCTDTEGSFVCTCREFYELGADGTTCNAVTDYCTVYGSRCNGTCNQNANDPTLFTCSCADPFVLWTGDGDQAYYQHKDDNSEEHLRANHSCVLPQCPLEAIATALNSNTIIWAHVNDTTRPFYHGQVLEVHCNRGYTYNNGDMMRSFICESQSNTLEWYVIGGSNLITDFQCDREVTCDGVNSTVSGVTFSSGLEVVCPHPFNYNISYTCDIDPVSNSYMLSPDVDCPVIDCGMPMQDETLGNIDLSSVTCTLYECSFEFTCSTGNQLLPMGAPTNVVCQENGVWNYTNIYCEGKSCPDPGIPANSYRYATADRDDTPLGITNFKRGGTLYFSCINAGYEMKNTDTGLSQNSLSCDGSSFDVTVDKLQCIDVEPIQLDETAVPECPVNWDVFKNTAPNNPPSLFGFATLPFSDNTGISKLSVSPLEFGHDYIYIEDVNITFTADDFEPSTPETSCTLIFNVQDVVPPVLKCLSEVNITIYNKTHPTPVTQSLFTPINVDPEAVLSYDYTQRLSDGELTFSDYDSESLYVTVTATKTYYRGRRSRGTNRTDTMTTTASCIIPVIPQLDACGLDFAPQPAGASGSYEIDGGVITYTYTCDNAKASFGFDHTSNTRVVRCGASIGVTDWERVPACTDSTPAVFSLSHILLLMGVTDISGCKSQLESNFITWLNTRICPGMLTVVTFSRDEKYNGTATNNMVTFVTDTVLMQDRIYFHPSAPGLDTLCAELYYNATKDKWPFDKSGTYFAACAPNVHVSNILLNQFRCPTGLVRAAAGSVEVGGVNYTYDACYPCATGSYSPAGEEFRVKGPCTPCAAGSFDQLEGGDSCSGCPTGFGSVEGDVACRVACQEGFYNSDTGLSPCIPCPVDTYWVNRTSCESCPTNTSNRDQAQSSPGACKAKCAAGTFSFDGYAPCTNCPMNTYQSATGQTECVRCNPGDETTQEGQTNCTMMATCPKTVSDNCLNSDCVALNGKYLCNQGCVQGRIGPDCSTEIDFCSSLPCNLIGANSCTDGQCLCNDMISNGITCNNITEILCDSKDCQNEGECVVQPSGQFPGATLQAVCLCSGQWSGENCTEVVDKCDLLPCMKGRYVTCVDRQVRPECQCKVGYTGYECEIDVDGCESSPCYNGGTCEDLVGAPDWEYMCQCLPGFTGRQCEVRLNECEQISCGDSAKCVDDYRTNETVVCLSEFYGPAVSAEVAVETDSWCESLNITCMNGGTCKDTENYKPGHARFYCDCTELYEGVFCQNFINFCETLNGYESCGVGNCTNLWSVPAWADTTGYYCSFCPDGFTSLRGACENLNECNNPSACNGQGTCINTVGSYYCECEDGYDGQFCQTEINECAMSPCLHDGICSDLFNDFDCTCPPTREGKTCENVMNTCADQCQNSGTCKPVFNNYVCDCIQPSYGRYCQVLHDVCETEQPCVYGGDCSIDIASLNVTCSNCDEGHHGEFCELWSDDCTSQPCINGGNCTLMYGEDYKCRCPDGYTGTNCEIMQDPCNPNLCDNSATCIQETFTEYFCQCAPGFFGISCNRAIDSNFQIFMRPGSASIMLRNPRNSPTWVDNHFTLSAWIRPDRIRAEGGDDINILQLTVNGQPLLTLSTCSMTLSGQTISYFARDECLPQAIWGFIGLSVDPVEPSVTIYTASLARKQPINALSADIGGEVLITLSPEGQFLGFISQVTLWQAASFVKGTDAGIDFQTLPSRTPGITAVSSPSFKPDNVLYFWSTGAYTSDPSAQVVRPADYCNCNDDDKSGKYMTFGQRCPADIVITTSARSAQVTWTLPTFIFNGEEITAEQQDYQPGEEFKVGVYDVTYKAMRLTVSLQCSFKIYVRHGCGGSFNYGGSICYEIINEQTTFDRAVARCENLGGTIVNINDFTKYQEVTQALTVHGIEANYYVGQQWKPDVSKVLYYNITDGNSYQPAILQRTTDTPVCITANLAADWMYTDCGNATGVICERDVTALDSCTPLKSPQSLINTLPQPTVSDSGLYTRYNMRCGTGQAASSVAPKLFTCYPEGGWDYGLARNTDEFPGCGDATPYNVKVATTFNIPSTGQCPANGLWGLLETVRQTLAEINRKWNGICATGDCSDIPLCCTGNAICDSTPECLTTKRHISANCDPVTTGRRKRDTLSNSLVNLFINALPPTITFSGEVLTPAQILERFLIDLKLFFEQANQVINVPDDADPLVGYTTEENPDCPAGFEAFNQQCVQCPAGSYEVSGVCTLCPIGMYGAEAGLTECTQCAAGTSTYTTGVSSADQCSEPCAAGSYYDAITTSCRVCALGYYQESPGQLMCIACDIGTNTDQTGSIAVAQCIDSCTSGYEYSPALDTCVICQIGFYRDAQIDQTCQQCTGGFITEGDGAMSVADCTIIDCPAGQYRKNTTNTCVPCAIGDYQPDIRQLECMSCGANYTTADEGTVEQTRCIFVCPSGSEANTNTPDDDCTLCNLGTYRTRNDSDVNSTCETCPQYFTTPNTGSNAVTDCTVLYCMEGMQPTADNSTCEPCKMGTYSDDVTYSGDTCTSCLVWFTTNITGAQTQDQCLRYCADGFEFDGTDCVACTEFEYKSNTDGLLELCQKCPNGNVTLVTNATSVDACMYDDCGAGFYIDNITNGCVECGVGFYSTSRWQFSCVQCDMDYTTDTTKSTRADHCKLNCPDGKKADGAVCVPCDVGEYKPGFGPSCEVCPFNYTTAGNGSTAATACSIALCAAGYKRVEVTELCEACPIGLFKDANYTSDTTCEVCPNTASGEAQTTGGTGADSDIECQITCLAGQQDELDVCVPCPVGTYKDMGGPATCTQCAAGFTTVSDGADNSTMCSLALCSAGEFSANSSCHPCPLNEYQTQNSYTGSSCTSCPVVNGEAKVTESEGSATEDLCIFECGPGRREIVTGCENCPVNTYKSLTDDQCISCPDSVSTNGVEGATSNGSCSHRVCVPGEQTVPGNTLLCEACPRNTYSTDVSVTTCTKCPGDGVTNTTGANSQDLCFENCPLGYSYDHVVGVCRPCPRGYYRDTFDTLTCTVCDDGYTTRETGTTERCTITRCTAGHRAVYNTDLSSWQCMMCDVGTYQPVAGAVDVCIACADGSTTENRGSTEEDNCVARATCLSLSGSPNHPCQGIQSCLDSVNGPVCSCPFGYDQSGPSCTHYCERPASNTYCKNGAACNKATTDVYGICQCASGYAGSTCEEQKGEQPSGITQTELIIASVVAAVVLLIIILAISIHSYRKRAHRVKRAPPKTHYLEAPPVFLQSSHPNSVVNGPAFYNSSMDSPRVQLREDVEMSPNDISQFRMLRN